MVFKWRNHWTKQDRKHGFTLQHVKNQGSHAASLCLIHQDRQGRGGQDRHTGDQWSLLSGRGPHRQVSTDRQGMLGQFSSRQPGCSVRISCGLAVRSFLLPFSHFSSRVLGLHCPLSAPPYSAHVCLPTGPPSPSYYTHRPPNHHISHPCSPCIHMCVQHTHAHKHTTHRDRHMCLTSWLVSSCQKVLFPAA